MKDAQGLYKIGGNFFEQSSNSTKSQVDSTQQKTKAQVNAFGDHNDFDDLKNLLKDLSIDDQQLTKQSPPLRRGVRKTDLGIAPEVEELYEWNLMSK